MVTIQKVANDTGINVLIDHAHQASFFTMWELPPQLRNRGLRVCGSQATIDTVLNPGALSRVRAPAGNRFPFSWGPNPVFNVVVTIQTDPQAQDYLLGEKDALKKFVYDGGGLIMVGGRVLDEQSQKQWPLNSCAQEFNAGFSSKIECIGHTQMPSLASDPDWEIYQRGDGGLPVVVRRQWGKGRLVLVSSIELWTWSSSVPSEKEAILRQRADHIAATIKWAAQGLPPVHGSLALPQEAGGGGPIYPELESRIGNVVVYYARNQKTHLLETVANDMPAVKRQIEGWLPSAPSHEPMYMILSAGSGGGWAVNAYLPKEIGIIALNKEDVLSIFVHELAHTMAGPPNEKGEIAGSAPHGNQGEAHAGWFQGKIMAQLTGQRKGHDPNQLFYFDPDGSQLDLAMKPASLRTKWGKGKDWIKLWWIFQKLDDRYGTTWYPRWRWVQHIRWQNDPKHELSWDEMVEDMSIAVGEDLFPFFRSIGTTLRKERFPNTMFRGEFLELPIAPISITPGGTACLEPAGDYKKKLRK